MMFRPAMATGTASIAAAVLALMMAGCSDESSDTQAANIEEEIDYCAEVSDETLAKLHEKKLFSAAMPNGCMWSEKPDGIADFSFSINESEQELRDYFNAELSPGVELVEITDLGDSGLMTLVEGEIGVVVIRKGDKVLQSAATFLDIAPGTEQQTVLWDIYRRALDR
jgi:hypothetical protein